MSAADIPVGDGALLDRLRRGDATALRELMQRYYARLVDVAAAYTANRDVAEDAVQAVLIDVWSRRSALPVASAFAPYLFGAVRKRAMSVHRAQHTRERYYHAAMADEATSHAAPSDPQAQLVLDELHIRLEREIDQLPPRCREIFRLSREANLTYQEIGALLGISPNTVRVQIAKALDHLRRDLAGWVSE